MHTKKFTSLLISCSLAVAGVAMAQQPDDQQEKNKKKTEEKPHRVEAKPRVNAVKPQTNAVQQHRAVTNERATLNANTHKTEAKMKTGAAAETNVSGQAATTATPIAKHAEQHRQGAKAANANLKAQERAATPAPTAAANATSNTSAMKQQTGRANMAAAKKPAPQQVQQIKAQHKDFRAQPKPEQVPAVTFQANYRIQNSDRWQGRQYEAFRQYHPERHDRNWYHSRYHRVELIGGGYYYWNNGYWYPAWGYDPSAEYYAYDAPIYVGHSAEPPDRVIADVQAALQEMGYYKGDVDGLLGPLTREALAGYQGDQGLTQTEVIDEPTLDSLGMS